MNLYISDLDGTLLNNKAVLSSTTIKLLNSAIQKDINFTIATARTPATVCDIMKDVNMSIPAVLMNGSVIYNVKNNHYISYNKMNIDTVKKILNTIHSQDMVAFTYTIKNDFLNVYYDKFTNPYQIKFYNERSDKTNYKKFINKSLPEASNVLYFTILDYEDRINCLYEKVKEIPGINLTKYKDNYNDGVFYLEIYDKASSKANGIKYLKKRYNFDKIISFGDNYNDIPMFNVSDKCYAVSNAVDDLKQISTSIIGSNIEDAVAKQILI